MSADTLRERIAAELEVFANACVEVERLVGAGGLPAARDHAAARILALLDPAIDRAAGGIVAFFADGFTRETEVGTNDLAAIIRREMGVDVR